MVWTGIAALALRRQRTHASTRKPARRPAQPPGTPGSSPPVAEPEGPGWFQSSRELNAGLAVCEGAPPGLEVYLWIELALLEIAQREARAAAAVAAFKAPDERPAASLPRPAR